jgi:hypothetical protein
MDRCADSLMEDSWEEGFECDLPAGHDGPHRDTGGPEDGELNESADELGNKYRWVYEWEYFE